MSDFPGGLIELVILMFVGIIDSISNNSSCKHCGKIIFLIILGIVIGIVYMLPQGETETVVNENVEQAVLLEAQQNDG